MSSNLRFRVVEEAFKKKAVEVSVPSERPSAYFGKYVSSNIGFRFTHYYDIGGKKSYWQPEPRALVMFHIPKVFTVKAAYSHVHQNLQCVTAYIIGLPQDRWIMSTGRVKPAMSQQFDVGIERSFLDGMLELSVDAYYKKMSDLAMMSRTISMEGMTGNISDLNVVLTGGNGKAKGIELLFANRTDVCKDARKSHRFCRLLAGPDKAAV